MSSRVTKTESKAVKRVAQTCKVTIHWARWLAKWCRLKSSTSKGRRDRVTCALRASEQTRLLWVRESRVLRSAALLRYWSHSEWLTEREKSPPARSRATPGSHGNPRSTHCDRSGGQEISGRAPTISLGLPFSTHLPINQLIISSVVDFWDLFFCHIFVVFVTCFTLLSSNTYLDWQWVLNQLYMAIFCQHHCQIKIIFYLNQSQSTFLKKNN